MPETDVAKIVNLIMENPKLIEEIRTLANNSGTAQEGSEEIANKEDPSLTLPDGESAFISEKESPATAMENKKHRQRRELLSALKSYVSPERGRAIESMLSIADILDMMRER